MVQRQKHELLVIVGAIRSGSTLLSIVLGSSPEIFSTGELIHLHGRGWLNNEYCACGQRVNDCAFWQEVKRRWTEQFPGNSVERFLELQRRFERPRFLFFDALLVGNPEFQEYLHSLNSLFHSVQEVSGRPCVVDSSKKPVHALYSSMAADQDVYVVHLVRDSRGVAWSKAKSLAKDERGGVQEDLRPAAVGRTARDWLLTNLLCSYLARKLPGHYLRVRYEDLVADPRGMLQRIGEFSGMDLSEPIRRLIEGEEMLSGHTVAGNRLRMNDTVRVRPDLEWKEKLGSGQESTVWRWTGWLLRYYGYAR
jgi:hypothetical protein